MTKREKDLQETLKAMKILLAKAHALADPIIAQWDKEDAERKKLQMI